MGRFVINPQQQSWSTSTSFKCGAQRNIGILAKLCMCGTIFSQQNGLCLRPFLLQNIIKHQTMLSHVKAMKELGTSHLRSVTNEILVCSRNLRRTTVRFVGRPSLLTVANWKYFALARFLLLSREASSLLRHSTVIIGFQYFPQCTLRSIVAGL